MGRKKKIKPAEVELESEVPEMEQDEMPVLPQVQAVKEVESVSELELEKVPSKFHKFLKGV
jgi:hypothetical protein